MARMRIAATPTGLLLGRQAQIEIEHLDALAARAAVHVQMHDTFSHVGDVAEQQVPSTADAARAKGNLPQRLHRNLAGTAGHELRSDEMAILNPSGSCTRNARWPHGMSVGSVS